MFQCNLQGVVSFYFAEVAEVPYAHTGDTNIGVTPMRQPDCICSKQANNFHVLQLYHLAPQNVLYTYFIISDDRLNILV